MQRIDVLLKCCISIQEKNKWVHRRNRSEILQQWIFRIVQVAMMQSLRLYHMKKLPVKNAEIFFSRHLIVFRPEFLQIVLFG